VSKEKQGWIIKNLRIVALRRGEVWTIDSHNKPLRRAKPIKASKTTRDRTDYWTQESVKEKDRLRKQRERAALVASGQTVNGTKRKRDYAARPKGRK
jgi:hypothetical protein